MSKPTSLSTYQASFWNKIREEKANHLTKEPGFERMVLKNPWLWHEKCILITMRYNLLELTLKRR